MALVSACGRKPLGRAKVAVSIFPVYDLTRRIAGPDADVTLLVPVGRSEVGFAPGPGEAAAAGGARLGVMVGLGLDAWMESLLKTAAPQARLLKVGDRVPTLASRQGAADPHVWLDPQRAGVMCKAIAEELARTDPKHAFAYRARADELGDVLDALDKEVAARSAAWKTRAFVTYHDDFAYFADRYHLHIAAVADETPGKSPAVVAEAAHAPLVALDAMGGGHGEEGGVGGDSYEWLIRFDVDALDNASK